MGILQSYGCIWNEHGELRGYFQHIVQGLGEKVLDNGRRKSLVNIK